MQNVLFVLTFCLGLFVGLPAAAVSQTSAVSIKGTSKGCFAGKIYHPGKVEIFVFDVGASPEIPQLIHQMDGYASRDDPQSQHKFFASYNQLLHLVRVSKALGRIRSDQLGNFTFSNFSTGLSVIVIGISPMEDDPAFYAFRELGKLKHGDNAVTLDFARGDSCK